MDIPETRLYLYSAEAFPAYCHGCGEHMSSGDYIEGTHDYGDNDVSFRLCSKCIAAAYTALAAEHPHA